MDGEERILLYGGEWHERFLPVRVREEIQRVLPGLKLENWFR
jgi:hypothetical protein